MLDDKMFYDVDGTYGKVFLLLTDKTRLSDDREL